MPNLGGLTRRAAEIYSIFRNFGFLEYSFYF
jgi:hypothetical protein